MTDCEEIELTKIVLMNTLCNECSVCVFVSLVAYIYISKLKNTRKEAVLK